MCVCVCVCVCVCLIKVSKAQQIKEQYCSLNKVNKVPVTFKIVLLEEMRVAVLRIDEVEQRRCPHQTLHH